MLKTSMLLSARHIVTFNVNLVTEPASFHEMKLTMKLPQIYGPKA